MTKPTWTPWIKNPGTGECPVPEWAEDYEVMIEGDEESDDDELDHCSKDLFVWGGYGKNCDITHYRYAIPADLAWLAENVTEWKPGKVAAQELGGQVIWLFGQEHDFAGIGTIAFTRAQHAQARKDLGLESASTEQDQPKRTHTDCGGGRWRQGDDGMWYGMCANVTVEPELEPEQPTAPNILQAALGHMQDRAATYDSPGGERSMAATVGAFREITGVYMTEEQGWLFMATLKAVRSQQGGYRADSYEDGAAYFGLAGEAAGRDRT